MVVKEKKNHDLGVCIDPRDLSHAIKRHYSILTLKDVAAWLTGKTVFTTSDEKHGYHQAELDDQSSCLCMFQTLFGRYLYKF